MPMDTTKYNHKPLILLLNIQFLLRILYNNHNKRSYETKSLCHRLVSFTLLPFFGKQLLLSPIGWLAALAMQCDTPKAYASHRFSSWRFQHSFLQERYYDIWSQAYLRTRAFWNRSLRSLYARFACYPKCVTHLWCVSATANPIPLLVSL